jgi:putative membrane protein
MNWKNVCLACSMATALLITSCDKDNDTEEAVNPQDQSFMVQASRSNRSEVELGTLALEKGTNSGVKGYAQMMVIEHNAAQDDLVDIVGDIDANTNINDSLDNDQIAMRTMLLSLPAGPSFDSAYIAGQSIAHQKTLTAFDTELAAGQNVRVKGYATDKRPSIVMHKAMADSLLTIVQ